MQTPTSHLPDERWSTQTTSIRRAWPLYITSGKFLAPMVTELGPNEYTDPPPLASPGFRLSQSSRRVRSATTVICGIIVALDSSEP